MASNEETFFNHILENAITLDGENTLDLVVRVYTTYALDIGAIRSEEELDLFIDERFRERQRNAETEDVERVKTNMIKARRGFLYRELSDIYRVQQVNSSEKLKERYNSIVEELSLIRNDSSNYFATRFGGKRRY